jgi:hypothetical protein
MIYKPFPWKQFLKELKKRNLSIEKTSWDWTVYRNKAMICTVNRQHPGEDNLRADSRQKLNRHLKTLGIEEI